jgi:hypothetical protein
LYLIAGLVSLQFGYKIVVSLNLNKYTHLPKKLDSVQERMRETRQKETRENARENGEKSQEDDGQDLKRDTVVFIPISGTEPPQALSKTLRAAAKSIIPSSPLSSPSSTSALGGDRKLLFIVIDGQDPSYSSLHHPSNTANTSPQIATTTTTKSQTEGTGANPDILATVLGILGNPLVNPTKSSEGSKVDEWKEQEEIPRSYFSLSLDQALKVNSASVYSGYFNPNNNDTHPPSSHGGVPYILVIKTGTRNERETYLNSFERFYASTSESSSRIQNLPGSRGRLDSLLILLTFLSRSQQQQQQRQGIHSSMVVFTPLEHEIYVKMTRRLKGGVHPRYFNFLVTLDSNIVIHPESLARLVRRFEMDEQDKVGSKRGGEDWLVAVQGKLGREVTGFGRGLWLACKYHFAYIYLIYLAFPSPVFTQRPTRITDSCVFSLLLLLFLFCSADPLLFTHHINPRTFSISDWTSHFAAYRISIPTSPNSQPSNPTPKLPCVTHPLILAALGDSETGSGSLHSRVLDSVLQDARLPLLLSLILPSSSSSTSTLRGLKDVKIGFEGSAFGYELNSGVLWGLWRWYRRWWVGRLHLLWELVFGGVWCGVVKPFTEGKGGRRNESGVVVVPGFRGTRGLEFTRRGGEEFREHLGAFDAGRSDEMRLWKLKSGFLIRLRAFLKLMGLMLTPFGIMYIYHLLLLRLLPSLFNLSDFTIPLPSPLFNSQSLNPPFQVPSMFPSSPPSLSSLSFTSPLIIILLVPPTLIILHSFLLIFAKRPSDAFSGLVFLVVGLPVWGILMPLYSFFTMDDLRSWEFRDGHESSSSGGWRVHPIEGLEGQNQQQSKRNGGNGDTEDFDLERGNGGGVVKGLDLEERMAKDGVVDVDLRPVLMSLENYERGRSLYRKSVVRGASLSRGLSSGGNAVVSDTGSWGRVRSKSAGELGTNKKPGAPYPQHPQYQQQYQQYQQQQYQAPITPKTPEAFSNSDFSLFSSESPDTSNGLFEHGGDRPLQTPFSPLLAALAGDEGGNDNDARPQMQQQVLRNQKSEPVIPSRTYVPFGSSRQPPSPVLSWRHNSNSNNNNNSNTTPSSSNFNSDNPNTSSNNRPQIPSMDVGSLLSSLSNTTSDLDNISSSLLAQTHMVPPPPPPLRQPTSATSIGNISAEMTPSEPSAASVRDENSYRLSRSRWDGSASSLTTTSKSSPGQPNASAARTNLSTLPPSTMTAGGPLGTFALPNSDISGAAATWTALGTTSTVVKKPVRSKSLESRGSRGSKGSKESTNAMTMTAPITSSVSNIANQVPGTQTLRQRSISNPTTTKPNVSNTSKKPPSQAFVVSNKHIPAGFDWTETSSNTPLKTTTGDSSPLTTPGSEENGFNWTTTSSSVTSTSAAPVIPATVTATTGTATTRSRSNSNSSSRGRMLGTATLRGPLILSPLMSATSGPATSVKAGTGTIKPLTSSDNLMKMMKMEEELAGAITAAEVASERMKANTIMVKTTHTRIKTALPPLSVTQIVNQTTIPSATSQKVVALGSSAGNEQSGPGGVPLTRSGSIKLYKPAIEPMQTAGSFTATSLSTPTTSESSPASSLSRNSWGQPTAAVIDPQDVGDAAMNERRGLMGRVDTLALGDKVTSSMSSTEEERAGGMLQQGYVRAAQNHTTPYRHEQPQPQRHQQMTQRGMIGNPSVSTVKRSASTNGKLQTTSSVSRHSTTPTSKSRTTSTTSATTTNPNTPPSGSSMVSTPGFFSPKKKPATSRSKSVPRQPTHGPHPTDRNHSAYRGRHEEDDADDGKWVTARDIRSEIMYFLEESESDTVTVGAVKEHLRRQFGDSVVRRWKEYISETIDDFALERLALM